MEKMLYCIIFAICFPSAFSCAFGDNKNSRTEFTNGTLWFERKLVHSGRLLSGNEISHLAMLKNEIHFKKMLNPIMVPRVVDTPSHAIVREHIGKEMKRLGWTIEEDSFIHPTPHGKKTFTNIITTLDSSAPRRLVLACHYDSKPTPLGFIGATDSAVPCAMLLNLAHILKKSLNSHNIKRTDITLQFIFFDGEEALVSWSDTDSLYGSRKLAEKLHNSPFPPGNIVQTSELHRMDMLVLLDLIGTADTRFSSLFGDTHHWFERLQKYETLARNSNLLNNRQTIFNSRKRFNSGIDDDHMPFLRKGVPILHLISVPFPSVWHKISDNANSLNYPLIADINLILRAFVTDYLSLSL